LLVCATYTTVAGRSNGSAIGVPDHVNWAADLKATRVRLDKGAVVELLGPREGWIEVLVRARVEASCVSLL